METPYVVDPDALLEDVKNLKKAGLNARKNEEKWWQLSWRFYEGDQWVMWANGAVQPINTGDKPRLVINKIFSIVQTRRAHLLKNKPVGTVLPETGDEEDRNAARVGDRVIQYAWRKHGIEEIYSDMSLDVEITGNSFVKVTWDPAAGKPVTIQRPVLDEAGEPQLDELTGEAVTEPFDTTTGDLCVEHVPSEEIVVEPGVRRMRDVGRLQHRTLKHISWAKKRWPEQTVDLQPIDPSTSDGASLLGAFKTYHAGGDTSNLVEVIEQWEKPSEKFPQGLYAVFIGDKFMEAKPTPPGHEHIPFVKFSEVQSKGFWSQSVVRHLLDINKTINLNVSQHEYNRKMLRPRPMASYESGLDENAFIADDAEVLMHNHGYAPSVWAPPPLRSTDVEERDFLGASAEDIGGSQDIMRGKAGSDVRSGRMVHFLQEYAGTVLGLVAQDFERGTEKIGNMILKLYKVYRTEEEIGMIVGDNKAVEILAFKGSDLDGCGDYVVQAGSALPMSRTEKHETVKELMMNGMLDPVKGMRMLGMPSDIDDLYNEEQLDRDNAEEENQQFELQAMGDLPETDDVNAALMMGGVEAREFENHVVHLNSHNKFRKSRVYKQMPPWAKSLVDAHCDQHVLFMAPPPMAAGPGMGAPPGPGGPPSPEDIGGPAALNGGMPPGGGGVGGGHEESQGLPPVPSVPAPHES